jgi:acetyl-CoA acetyltransferase
LDVLGSAHGPQEHRNHRPGARSAIGRFGGALEDVPAHELGVTAAKAALARSAVPGADIAALVIGCIGQVGANPHNTRRVALLAGMGGSQALAALFRRV